MKQIEAINIRSVGFAVGFAVGLTVGFTCTLWIYIQSQLMPLLRSALLPPEEIGLHILRNPRWPQRLGIDAAPAGFHLR
jgi:hypothetical protein